ncbi:synaptopodin 2-like protein [Gadus chalcogrammus]|uniref:synaptopodin 2-like protein n=1 Tax=Gadus chalcogrammus TaxID=1042646 RepID=UPI0024C4C200|nr:synaptopodin 2-like protein [Gadus chalcogrammus]
MLVEDVVVSLSGGAPWGFRLQGGAEHERPLQVAKVRRRSKACRAGLKEDDELVAIGDQTCTELSHSQAMNLIDMQSATLNLRVKRAPAFCVSSASPRVAGRGMLSPPVGGGVCITSPPDSEAYYGETDSDADIQTPALRRQRRTPPHPRSPARYESRDEEETTSEMSGYESAPDGGGFLHALWEPTRPLEGLPGVPRRELVYQPPEERAADHPAPLTPHTLTPRTLTPTQDQGLMDGEGEVDSGFQEAGSCVPLVSLERAKEAMMMGSSRQLVPMVGPQLGPISDELSTSYVDKAIQAKLHRGESVVEKQVKEARTKCRSIASLLTDAPNPNSKGVLMFKKRRQRAKKYTLTCFGKAEGEDTEGDTGGETEEEEGGGSALSGSEVEEEDFSASYDPTWDSGYLDLLDRMSSACPGTTPTTPSTHRNPGLDPSAYQSPGSEYTGYNGVAFQGPRLESGSAKQPIAAALAAPHSAPMSPHAAALTNGASMVVSRASVVLTPAAAAPGSYQAGPQQQQQQQQHHHQQPTAYQRLDPAVNSEHHALAAAPPNANAAAGVLNRTARPFGSGPGAARAPVAFRPPQPRSAAAASVTAATRPVTAVSAVTIQPQRPLPGPEARRAVSTTSLYISPRGNGGNNNNGAAATFPPPAPLPPPPTPPHPTAPTHPYINVTGSPVTHPAPVATMATAGSPQQPPPPPPPPQADSLASREQRISVPAARTGILQDARRRANNKPMFCAVQNKDVSPNPALLSMLQNMDSPTGPTGPAQAPPPAGDAGGHESGPEEDWLRLGAEACNFMQAQRGPRPPPVAPKPQAPQAPQMGQMEGKGGQLFARRQSRMDRYVVDRSPSAAAAPFSPGRPREASPTPSLPATWKYSSSIRAPPPISYNPLLSPSCPLKAQKPQKAEAGRAGPKTGSKTAAKKGGLKPLEIMTHQPYQLNSSLFTYVPGAPQMTSSPQRPQQQQQQQQQQRGTMGGYQTPMQTARVREVKRFSTPPPVATGPSLKVLVPRSVTSLGEPTWRSEPAFSYQPAPGYPQPQPQPQPHSQSSVGGPRPRFSTSNLGLQPCVWRPAATMH